jgi:flagellar basal-body rod modification protein FlgD
MATAAAISPGIVSGTTPLGPASATSGIAGANGTLAGNFQTFLTLLTTQLQHQNPLEPLDTNQFTQQLVQFAGVEQQLRTNDQLGTLVSLQQSTQSAQALEYVGKTATVDGSSTALANGKASWSLGVEKDSNVDVTITNAVGQTVFTGQYTVAAGAKQSFTWDGKGTNGVQWPDGTYKMTATAKDLSGNSVGVSTQVSDVVSSVDLTQSPPLLTIGGQTYTLSQIKGIIG